ncbi:MAG: helicase HerA domain-containing protein [Candidatus Baldrarchaeia archaeon]
MNRQEDRNSAIIGSCIGEATPERVTFISKGVPKVGEYVVLEYDGRKVLGMIEALVRGSVSITEDILDPSDVERIKRIEGDIDHYIKGTIRILGDVDSLMIPRIPPPPGTEVKRADDGVLQNIFGNNGRCVRLGVLLNHPNVPVYVDVNSIISRHLAILAITGAGKSNTVAVLVDGILRYGGCVLIFDMHSEYVDTRFKHGDVNPIETKINPLYLSFPELSKLMKIGEKAYIQERYLRMAYNETRERFLKGEISVTEFFSSMKKTLQEYLRTDQYKKDKNSIMGVINKLDELLEKYGFILSFSAPDVVDTLKLGAANIVDLGCVDEEVADVVVSHFLRRILQERKNYKMRGEGLRFPILIVIEEAHILAPKDRDTYSKYWISRIAREGRKFGVGLCLVSQRPKSLDANALSQVNNMIILRLVEPSDQRHVQAASEMLSDDLLAQLPSLNVGEAIVLGLMIKIPALVKIDKFEGKISGGDVDVVDEWRRLHFQEKDSVKREHEELKQLMGDW